MYFYLLCSQYNPICAKKFSNVSLKQIYILFSLGASSYIYGTLFHNPTGQLFFFLLFSLSLIFVASRLVRQTRSMRSADWHERINENLDNIMLQVLVNFQRQIPVQICRSCLISRACFMTRASIFT